MICEEFVSNFTPPLHFRLTRFSPLNLWEKYGFPKCCHRFLPLLFDGFVGLYIDTNETHFSHVAVLTVWPESISVVFNTIGVGSIHIEPIGK